MDVIDAVAVKVECLGRQSSWNLDGELLSTQCLSAEVHQGLLEVSGWRGGRGLGCGVWGGEGGEVCVWGWVCVGQATGKRGWLLAHQCACPEVEVRIGAAFTAAMPSGPCPQVFARGVER